LDGLDWLKPTSLQFGNLDFQNNPKNIPSIPTIPPS